MSQSTCWRPRRWSSWWLSGSRAFFPWSATVRAQIPRPQQTQPLVRAPFQFHSAAVLMACSLQCSHLLMNAAGNAVAVQPVSVLLSAVLGHWWDVHNSGNLLVGGWIRSDQIRSEFHRHTRLGIRLALRGWGHRVACFASSSSPNQRAISAGLSAGCVCATGIVQRRLSNGMKINYCQTDNEPQAAMVRMVAAGGRAMEGQGAGPSGTGVVSIGTRTLSESGTVGGWRRDQVQAAMTHVVFHTLKTSGKMVFGNSENCKTAASMPCSWAPLVVACRQALVRNLVSRLTGRLWCYSWSSSAFQSSSTACWMRMRSLSLWTSTSP